MANAKAEFVEAIKLGQLECAKVCLKGCQPVVLAPGFSALQLEQFLSLLDFEYDSGYGVQQLFGHIWLADGSWLDRAEYDGSEWWEHRVRPEF